MGVRKKENRNISKNNVQPHLMRSVWEVSIKRFRKGIVSVRAVVSVICLILIFRKTAICIVY